MLVVDALAIQMAGRQRILIKKSAAEACLLATGTGEISVLKETTELFEKTLVALRDGLPSVGIRKPPNAQVLGKIEDAWGNWQESRSALAAVEQGSAIDAGAVTQITANSEQILKDMNDLVILYILSTPGRDGAIRALLAEIAEIELVAWTQDPDLIAAVKAQNKAHAGMAKTRIDELDLQWRAEAKQTDG
jgi:hypothetical protein